MGWPRVDALGAAAAAGVRRLLLVLAEALHRRGRLGAALHVRVQGWIHKCEGSHPGKDGVRVNWRFAAHPLHIPTYAKESFACDLAIHAFGRRLHCKCLLTD